MTAGLSLLPLTMEKPVYGGECLARMGDSGGAPGKAIFVPLTLPGEVVSARITEEKRNFAKAELAGIAAASPSRVAPLCPHFGVCGGCHYQHADYPAQLAMKEQILRETLARAGVAIPARIAVLAAEPWAYRNRIRLAVAPEAGLGYRGRRSHAIVPVSECPVAAPGLLPAARQAAAFLAKEPNRARISEMELFTNPGQSQILLTLFCDEAPPRDAQSLAGLASALPSEIAGIRVVLSGASPMPPAAWGESSLAYPAAGFSYRVDHGAFFQVNRWLIDDFVDLVAANASGKTAWDLYAGVGLFARRLTTGFDEVVAVESAPASLAALQANLAGTSGRAVASTTLDFLRRNRAEREPRPDRIVLDPPRAGLGEETASLLNSLGAPELVYASCDPATLARDLRILTRERYRIDAVALVDMFPQTFHIETVVRLSRS